MHESFVNRVCCTLSLAASTHAIGRVIGAHMREKRKEERQEEMVPYSFHLSGKNPIHLESSLFLNERELLFP